MRWCLYLRHIEPRADEKFILNNATTRYLPSEIKAALSNLTSRSYEKSQKVVSSLLEKEKERLTRLLKNNLQRDYNLVVVLQMLTLLGEEREQGFEINDSQLNKLKDLSTNFWDDFSRYVQFMKNLGIVLETNYGSILIPKIVKEVFANELQRSTDVRIFESWIDAQAFMEEEMAKALYSIKIWDPYTKAKTLDIIERVVKPPIQIEILSSLPSIKDEVESLRSNFDLNLHVVYKEKSPQKPFHDRYLIIDNKTVWHFGPSFHDAGRKEFESAVRLPETNSKIIVDAFKYNYLKNENEWRNEGYKVMFLGYEAETKDQKTN
ncbi:MAG: hypothetical protein ACOC1X_03355 [Promethearchaeota archaeon]